jgi:hypothetical protein
VNIALGAIILVLLILPAISFRFGVNRSSELKELIATISITDSFWVFLIIPVLIHFTGILLVPACFGEIRYNTLFYLIIGNKDLVINNSFFQIYLFQFLGYTLLSTIIGYAIGLFFSGVEDHVDQNRDSLWRKVSLSRLLGLQNNQWYSLLDANEQAGLVFVDILSQTKETTVIYSGFLHKYYFKHNSKELAYIVISIAVRRDMRAVQLSDTQAKRNLAYYSTDMGTPVRITPGEYFVIPRENILNINILYIADPESSSQKNKSTILS